MCSSCSLAMRMCLSSNFCVFHSLSRRNYSTRKKANKSIWVNRTQSPQMCDLMCVCVCIWFRQISLKLSHKANRHWVHLHLISVCPMVSLVVVKRSIVPKIAISIVIHSLRSIVEYGTRVIKRITHAHITNPPAITIATSKLHAKYSLINS